MARSRQVLRLAAWLPLLVAGPLALAAQPTTPAPPTTAAAKAETKPLPATQPGVAIACGTSRE